TGSLVGDWGSAVCSSNLSATFSSVPSARGAEENVALCVEPGQLGRAGEPGEVIAALAVFGLVIDDAVFDLHLSDAEVALAIGGVVLRIPQAEFDGREDR